jgi:hypothetical protein
MFTDASYNRRTNFSNSWENLPLVAAGLLLFIPYYPCLQTLPPVLFYIPPSFYPSCRVKLESWRVRGPSPTGWTHTQTFFPFLT